MSNRNRGINGTGNVVDVEVRDGQARQVEGEQPLPPAEAPRGGFISNFLNYNFTVGGVVKGIALIAGGVTVYQLGKKKGRKQARSEYDAQYQNEYETEADYRQVDSAE